MTTSPKWPDDIVTAAEANRSFSAILRGIREGRHYVVTSHGRPVARIVPAAGHPRAASVARAALLSRLQQQPVADAGPWSRDELYDDAL